eukprot:scaffold13639_cov19-Tisochrysis_lutea.AAC.1
MVGSIVLAVVPEMRQTTDIARLCAQGYLCRKVALESSSAALSLCALVLKALCVGKEHLEACASWILCALSEQPASTEGAGMDQAVSLMAQLHINCYLSLCSVLIQRSERHVGLEGAAMDQAVSLKARFSKSSPLVVLCAFSQE